MVNGALWFLLAYLGASAWIATACLLHQGSAKARPFAAGLTALLIMWITPALLIASFFPSRRSDRK